MTGSGTTDSESPSGHLEAEIARVRRAIERATERESQLRGIIEGAKIELQQVRSDREQWQGELRGMTVQPVRFGPTLAVPPPPSLSPMVAAAPTSSAPMAPAPTAPEREPEPEPETSTRTVQNVLFVLGGLLLGTAAIAFTAVAWATFGQLGRALVLTGVTILVLAVPLVALARGLRATAETFAAIGLLLLLLDGYAAWFIDVARIQSIEPTRYAGLVALVTALVAYAYRRFAGLVGPAFPALVLAQPVPFLVLAPLHLSRAEVCFVAAGMALANLGVAAWLRRDPADGWSAATGGLHGVAWSLFAFWTLVASIEAGENSLAALDFGLIDRALAGAATVTAALVLLAGAAVSGHIRFLRVASGALVPAVAVAACLVWSSLWPGHPLIVGAGVTAALSVVVVALKPWLPVRVRTGPRGGALAVAGLVTAAVAVLAVVAAAITILAALPAWSAELGPTGPHPPIGTWQLPVAAVLAALAQGVATRARSRLAVVSVGGLFAVLALPASVALPWWTPPPIALAGAALALTAALVGRTRRVTAGAAACAAALVLDAVLTGLARPGLTAATLGGLTLLMLATAGAAGWWPRQRDDRLVVGGIALTTALVAAPAAIGSAFIAGDIAVWWAARATVLSLVPVLTVVALLRRSKLVGWAFGGLAVSAIAWPALAATQEAPGVYAALSVLAIVLGLAVLPHDRLPLLSPAGLTAAVPGLIGVAVVVALPLLTVLGGPYAWLDSVWSGAPTGLGIYPPIVRAPATVSATDAVSLGLLTVAIAIAIWTTTRRVGTAISGLGIGGPSTVLLAIVAAGAPWPAVPATTLLIGLILLAVAGIARLTPVRGSITAVQSIVYLGAGLTGSLSTRWSTLVALGALVLVTAVIGAIGRTEQWRVAGWLTMVIAGTNLAGVAGAEADLRLRQIGFIVLGAGIVFLYFGAFVKFGLGGRPGEGRAIQAAAHAIGLIGILLAASSAGVAALACVIWGLAIGLAALLPRVPRPERVVTAAMAGTYELVAWWLLLADRGVTMVEAYSLPLALVALVAGWASLRVRPDLRSWIAYGPGLAAAFLPTLATVIGIAPGEVWRRLALGVGALIVVVLGSLTRRQAPVVIGGLVLIAVALHELVLLWQLLPGWIPLAVGGAILVGLAITYERRRRDLTRLFAALDRMT